MALVATATRLLRRGGGRGRISGGSNRSSISSANSRSDDDFYSIVPESIRRNMRTMSHGSIRSNGSRGSRGSIRSSNRSTSSGNSLYSMARSSGSAPDDPSPITSHPADPNASAIAIPGGEELALSTNTDDDYDDYIEGDRGAQSWGDWISSAYSRARQAPTNAYDFIINAPSRGVSWARNRATSMAADYADTYTGGLSRPFTDWLEGRARGDDSPSVPSGRNNVGRDRGFNNRGPQREQRSATNADGGVAAGVPPVGSRGWSSMNTKEKAKKGAEIAGGTLAASMLFTDVLPGIAQIIEAVEDEPEVIIEQAPASAAPSFGGSDQYTYGGSVPYEPMPSSAPASNNAVSASPASMAVDGSGPTTTTQKSGSGYSLRQKSGGGSQNMLLSQMRGGHSSRANLKRDFNGNFMMPSLNTTLNKGGSGLDINSFLQHAGMKKRRLRI